MSDYPAEQNQRHYQRMQAALSGISSDRDTRSLGSLISTLDFLFEALEGVDMDWKNRFRTQWGMLEEVNAFALDAGRTSFSDDERKLIDGAVQDLKTLIDEVRQAATD